MEKEYKIIKIKESDGAQYKDCYVEVVLEVKTGPDSIREELTIRYPIQGKRHLIMLMEDVTGKRSMDHIIISKITAKIKEVLDIGS